MNARTIAELDLRRAQLTERATRLEAEWRRLPHGTLSVALGKEVGDLKERAGDLAALLRVAEGMS